jgi:signal transduction histidine kinase
VDLAFESGRSAERHPDVLESALYRLVQEALTNVVKHASATTVQISLVEYDGQVEVSVRDDGDGFDPDAATAGFGVLGMRERVLLLDGQLEVESAPSAGTAVHARIPLAREADDTAAASPYDATG